MSTSTVIPEEAPTRPSHPDTNRTPAGVSIALSSGTTPVATKVAPGNIGVEAAMVNLWASYGEATKEARANAHVLIHNVEGGTTDITFQALQRELDNLQRAIREL